MAFCPRCAAPNVDTANICTACGGPLGGPGAMPPQLQQQVPPPYTPYTGGAPMGKTNGLAVAGFICSIAGLLCGLVTIVGLILSAIGMSQIKKSGGTQRGHGLALAGVIIGSIMLALQALYFVILIAAKN